MNVIGKMLVFFVLVLAIAWNALVVNAYVTRTNWKKQADGYQAEAQRAAEAANNERKLREAERDAAEDNARTIREDRDRLFEQLKIARKSSDEVAKAYQDRQKADRDQGAQANQLQANLTNALTQVDDLKKLLATKEKAIDDQTLIAERAVADMVRAQIEADQQKRRYELANDARLRERDQRAGGAPGGGILDRSPPAPTAFRGTVRNRDGNLVAMTPGADSGLQVGAVLDVYRDTGGGRYLGKIKVTHVDPKDAVGQYIPKPGATADDYPRQGDKLKPD